MSNATPVRAASGDPVVRAPDSPEHEAFARVVLAASGLVDDVAEVVRDAALTEPQFNALRILRGAGRAGLPCRGIAERMLTRVPDITRLVDRLERMGLAVRRRDAGSDRRVVRVAITARGRAALRPLDAPVRRLHRRQFEDLSRTELRSLIRILAKIRTR